ncbi:hypothetical protein FACS1894162_7570 [Bacteroidia bacterium]|nr:hypothetical protein FACS1894162_7570 [Bacteroidia bacterium]
MYSKSIVRDTLQHIDEMLHTLIEGTKNVETLDDLMKTPDGILQLNGVCMCYYGKLARTVLIGESGGNADDLLNTN